MDVTVIVTTFGTREWNEKGNATALEHDGFHYHHHDPDRPLGRHRNDAVLLCGAKEWLCFLDAGDDLEPGYMEAMQRHSGHTNDLLVPMLRLGDGFAHDLTRTRRIIKLNPCPIGTLIHRTVFDRVGGFWDEPAWEDWSLFRRAVLTGSELRATDAVYHAPLSPDGRNSTIKDPTGLYNSILKSHTEWMKTR